VHLLHHLQLGAAALPMAELLDRLKAALADRYAIEIEVGHGGMATVYLARGLTENPRDLAPTDAS